MVIAFPSALLTLDTLDFSFMHLPEEHDAGVSHGEGQAQDSAAHDGVAQVED